MAAPSGIVWGSTVGSYGKIGIYRSLTSTNDKTTVNVEIWFWSKYSVSDSGNTLYYDNRSSSGSASTSQGSVSISTTNDSGSGWSESNQKKLKSYSYTYNRDTSAVTRYLYAKLTNVDRVGGTMYASTTFTIPKLPSYTVTYNANGGSGAPGSQTKWYGTALKLSTTKPTRTGHSFLGWATSSSATSANGSYDPGDSYSTNAALTLYAVWKANTYTIKFNANGGSGAPADQTKTYGKTLTLSSTKPTRTNYTFLGWSTSATATSATYSAGGSYTANSGATLYAVWQLAYKKPTISNLTVSRRSYDPDTGTYTQSDAGTYARVYFNWSTFLDATGAVIKCTAANTIIAEKTLSIAGKNGISVEYIGGSLSADTTYTISVTVKDSNGQTTVRKILPGAKYVMDLRKGGTGIAFGKAAETDGIADFAFKIVPNQGFEYPVLPAGTDLNTVLTPNIYSGENVSTYNYQNCPITNGTFTLEVIPAGPNGQRIQRLYLCDKTKRQMYERTYYGSSWQDDNQKWYGGWHNADLTALGNFTNYYASGSEAPKYRRVGNTVEIRGTVKPLKEIAYSTDYTTIFTLPNGYRPSSSVFTLCQGSGSCVWLMRVDNNGDVGFTRYRNGDASIAASDSVWLPFQCTFLVD